jgi:CRISPR-associated protein Csx10
LSDAAPGSGEGGVGGIDRDVAYDKAGLPYIPGRRLKGCLLEAAKELSEALEQHRPVDFFQSNSIEQIFGKPGQTMTGWLRIDNASLEAAAELGEWLDWMVQQNQTFFGSEAVRSAYTGLRAQTSMDRTTGGPVANTLRVSRVLRRKLVFIASIDLVSPDEISDIDTTKRLRRDLALACTAFRRLGSSRNRGWGEVKVTLHDGDDYSTDKAIEELETALQNRSVIV